ncbi:family 20 glycosylhydrolase [Alteromonas oceanisediminis]|uniref:family 20 glycosylhydrolase n=1 Tax=Alteromonas oceanisediminis TaxID=2836180 RepID=UPI001BDB38B4|nr:family 20 glycosylhydrolase [Alteromonas oceanisediminis]MBT0586789.1 carbohydate-binding domain-containing protein [Alteromonas oceanisediminis]
MRNVMLAICIALFSTGSVADHLSQEKLASLAETLEVSYQVQSNFETSDCARYSLGECFSAELTITFEQPISTHWQLIFSHLSPIAGVDAEHFTVEHVNGDLHRLRINQDMIAGQTITGTLYIPFWHASRSDVVPNMYVTAKGLEAVLVSSTAAVVDPSTGVNYASHAGHWNSADQFKRGPNDVLPIANAEWLYTHYQRIVQPDQADIAHPDSPRIIPQPLSSVFTGQRVTLPNGITLEDEVSARGLGAAKAFMKQAQLTLSDNGLRLQFQSTSLPSGHYRLSIEQDRIVIHSGDNVGSDYALLSLVQLYDSETATLPIGQIEDGPAYEYRGMHLDIARNFPGKQAIFDVVNEMYRGKLNKLHLHFADDEGWRVAIPELPELTEIGGFRCADESQCLQPQLGAGPSRDTSVNGFLSQQDYIELLQYAASRHVEVIPSFDMPGHSRAAIMSMQARYDAHQHNAETDYVDLRLTDSADTTEYSSIQYYNDNTMNPCIERSYAFVDTVLDSLIDTHHRAGVTLKTFHMGADETAGAWVESPACRKAFERELSQKDVHDILGLFVRRVYLMTQDKGLTLAGWSDGMSTVPAEQRSDNMLVTFWQTLASGGDQTAQDWVESPAKIVYAFPDVLYFDFPYANHPLEPGYYWASKNTDTFKVFQFTPEALSVHRWLWKNRMGHPFETPENPSAVSTGKQATTAPHGIQGQLWSEVVRTPESLGYMVYPRLYALAERAWHKPAWTDAAQQITAETAADKLSAVTSAQRSAWRNFAAQVVRYHLPQLEQLGINFRLPPPGVFKTPEGVQVNSLYPDLIIEYQRAKSTWQPVKATTTLETGDKFRTRLPDSTRVSAVSCLSSAHGRC